MSLRDERKQQSRQALLDAALLLSTSGRAFSSMSLREMTRHAGLVPAAFYRHFANMDQLGLELIDQAALHLKGVLHQLGQAYLYQPNAKTKVSLDIFFQAVAHHPEPWIFLISERWGGSAALRLAIDREIQFLIDDFGFVKTDEGYDSKNFGNFYISLSSKDFLSLPYGKYNRSFG